MPRYFYKYTRPQKQTNYFADPDHSLFESEGLTITETPYSNDKTYVCYIESDEAKINGILNSNSEYNWQKFNNIDTATQWCNDNIPHEVGQEFTNDGNVIIDNRLFDDIV